MAMKVSAAGAPIEIASGASADHLAPRPPGTSRIRITHACRAVSPPSAEESRVRAGAPDRAAPPRGATR